MEPQESDVQYSRWNETCQDEVNINVSSTSTLQGISKQLCTGTLGIAMKLIGALVILSLVFIIGYVTGYYIHK
ncbi:small integral membrane protein 1 [Acipenser ruthenus]|uniref:small integral membrane protein 1 n=1 Tax=Acipenser ruthenus TaxID=7906 RepID=UPI002740A387|nr:small integral membrane protein 1 [Acipenser ruthenus]XP_058849104.1 small integral membrane protein 1 [Acipenser ruthenus]XP_058849105.1 small integral membrane protein 1 [Acipenser ruthenus]